MSSSQNGEINNTSSGDRFFTIIDNNDIDQDNDKLFSSYSGSNSSNSQDSDRPLLYVNAASNDDSGKPVSSYDETISSASKDENGLSIDKLIRECRITSDGSSVFEDLPFCDAHGHVKDLFCGDCMTEICVDCVKHFHNSHSLYPGLSCKDMIQETERARIIVKDNIDTIEKNISNLQIKRVLISGRVKSFFRHYRQIVNEKEAELLNRIDYTLDYRLNILNEKLKENQVVMNANLRLMNLIAEHLKNHDMESVMRDGAYAKKHLEVLRSLPNTWIPSDENINFVPPENPAIIPLNDIDFSGPCSIVTPISDSNRLKGKSRFDNVMNTAFNKTEENFYQHFGPTSVSPTPFHNQPSFFDDKSTNFVSVGTSQTINKSTIGGLASGGRNFMSVNESPSAVEPSSNRFGFNRSLSAPNYVNNDDFFNFSNPMQNFNFNEPVILNRIAYDPNAGFLNAINDVGAFPVSFHTRRNYARIKKPVLVFGQEGSGDNDLCRPWGVCCDRQGHIIVADRSNNRISIFRTDGSHVRCFGKLGSEEGEFSRPAGVAIDYFGRIVIADKDNHRVQVMTMEGEFVFAFGERGAHNGKFHYPWDVDVNSVGSIIVSDTRNHRIQLFSGNGMFLKKFGYENLSTMWKYFDSPRGVCFLTEHIILVTDFNNHKLFEIDMEKNPKIVNVDNFKRCEFFRPQGVAVDADGNVLVADCRNHRIQVFTRQGEILGAFGVNGKELGQFDRPSGIALTPDGKIVVVDFGNHRIQVF